MIKGGTCSVRHELVGLGGVVERNWYLVKRYAWWELAFFLWTVANTLTIVFIAKGVEAAGGTVNVNELTTVLLIGAVIWAYLGIIFEILTETVAWERWEGTIEYTFMAPLSRPVHLIGMGLFAVAYGVVRAALLFGVVAAFFGLRMPDANFASALLILAIASVSFIGIGMMTAVLPLISPEKGSQLGFIAQGLLLVVSGVYYPTRCCRSGCRGSRRSRPRPTRCAGSAPRSSTAPAWTALGRHLAADPDRDRRGPARARDLPPRRAVREAARKAEAVGMIRVAETDADLELWAAIKNAVMPDEPISAAELRRLAKPERLLLLAELDGVPAAARSPRRRAGSAPASSGRAFCPATGGGVWARRSSAKHPSTPAGSVSTS